MGRIALATTPHTNDGMSTGRLVKVSPSQQPRAATGAESEPAIISSSPDFRLFPLQLSHKSIRWLFAFQRWREREIYHRRALGDRRPAAIRCHFRQASGTFL